MLDARERISVVGEEGRDCWRRGFVTSPDCSGAVLEMVRSISSFLQAVERLRWAVGTCYSAIQ